jgi:hypothetical protein
MGSGESVFIKDLSDVSQGFDEPECKKIFDAFDKGKTGYLSKDVAIKFLTKYAKVKKLSNPKQFAESTFTRLDTNKDGRLAYDELLKRQAIASSAKAAEPETKHTGRPECAGHPKSASCLPSCRSLLQHFPTCTAERFLQPCGRVCCHGQGHVRGRRERDAGGQSRQIFLCGGHFQ